MRFLTIHKKTGIKIKLGNKCEQWCLFTITNVMNIKLPTPWLPYTRFSITDEWLSYKYKLLCPRGTQTCALAVANIAHAVREMLDVAKRPIPQG